MRRMEIPDYRADVVVHFGKVWVTIVDGDGLPYAIHAPSVSPWRLAWWAVSAAFGATCRRLAFTLWRVRP